MDRHESLWLATSTADECPALRGDLRVDVAVVGAGIVGLVAATLLREAGRRVVVLEARRAAQGVTGHTTAKLTSLHTLIYADLIDKHGREAAAAYGQANEAGINLVRRLSQERRIDCDLTDCRAYTYAMSDEEAGAVAEEAEAARSLGLPVGYHEQAPLPFVTTVAVSFADQAHFHPRRFLLPLAQDLAAAEALYERTRVVEVDAGHPCRLRTDTGHTVTADEVLVLTSLPILDRGFFFSRTEPRRGYALAVEPGADGLPEGLFINVSSPTHSIRPASWEGRPILILSGEGHPVGEARSHRDSWRRLEEWGQRDLGAGQTLFHWSTQDYYSLDKLPFVGKVPAGADRLFTATGFSAWGMSNGMAAAIMLTDLVLERENPWVEVFSPARIKEGLFSFAKKGAKDAFTLVRGRLKDGLEPEDVDQVAAGSGRIAEVDGDKLAVSRDTDGRLEAVDAACTHMGCIVSWNDAEGSWDCPCHGSRFARDGDVLQSPALEPLAPRRDVLAEGLRDQD
jgi:glycine/D-amino acid oxidase-like deaminating enzyme/nitrite reductase/ring-hydroxylating ferredoxin subunit